MESVRCLTPSATPCTSPYHPQGPFLIRYKPGKGPASATTCWHTPGIAYAVKTPAQLCSGNYNTAINYGHYEDNPREDYKFCPCEMAK